MSTENLQYLTNSQALADAAKFVDYYKQLDSRVSESSWVVFGASYAGAMTQWLRLKYPHLIAGAISSSGPVQAIYNFKAFFAWIQDSLGATCSSVIREATKQLEPMLRDSNKWPELTTQFHLCDPYDGSKNDISSLVEVLAEIYEMVVQYNNDNRAFEVRKNKIQILILFLLFTFKFLFRITGNAISECYD